MNSTRRLIGLAATLSAAALAIVGVALASAHAVPRASTSGCAKPGLCSPQPPQTKSGTASTAAQLTRCLEAHGLIVPASTPLKVWLESAVSNPSDAAALTACGLDAGPPPSK